MDNELKVLKQHLNRTVYRGQHFTEKNKMNIRQRIHQSSPQPSYNHFKSLLGVIVCFAMLIGLGTFAWRQMTAQDIKTPVSQSGHNGNSSAEISHIQPFSFVFVLHKELKIVTSVMVVTVNPHDKTVMLLSLPPNLQVAQDNNGVVEDLQLAYSKGELNEAIQKTLGIPAQNVAVFDNDTFIRTINESGGVTVNNPFAFKYKEYHFQKGKLQLDGIESLAYFTMIYEDPKGEIGRIERQEDVMKSLLQRVSVQDFERYMLSHKKIDDLDSFIENVVRENKANDFEFKSIQLNLSTKIGNGVFYYFASPEEIKSVMDQMKNQQK